jgi:hypothetical protein
MTLQKMPPGVGRRTISRGSFRSPVFSRFRGKSRNQVPLTDASVDFVTSFHFTSLFFEAPPSAAHLTQGCRWVTESTSTPRILLFASR